MRRRLSLCLLLLLVAGCGGHDKRPAARSDGGQHVGFRADDWPLFGRDRDNTRFAPATSIGPTTIGQLGVAWKRDLGRFQYLMESFPIVVGRTMYVTTSTDEVTALDAATGKLKWRYSPTVDFSLSTGVGGYGVTVNRGVAVADGRVFVLTFDDHLRAVSQATGEELWSAQVADPHTGAYETMAPTVYDGRVYVGDSGAEDGVRGFVAAYDARTGRQLWRFWTVPAPGHGWVPKGRHGGGTVYMPPTVDTRTGLVYVGTGNPSPAIVGTSRPGPDLYTDSILALDARTGRLRWHHQEVAHDLWDYDAESPVVIFDTVVRGRRVHAVAEAGKSGYLFILDAATGKDLFPRVAFVREDHKPPTRSGTLEYPGVLGGSQYGPIAYSPHTHAVYVSGIELPFVLKVAPGAHTGEKDFGGLRSIPDTAKAAGTFSAVDVRTGRFLWRRRMPTPMVGGATVTGSDVVLTGDQNGTLWAFDARTGEVLRRIELGLAFGSAPIVYTVGRREYIAVAIGGSALTAAKHLGHVGSRVVALSLGAASSNDGRNR